MTNREEISRILNEDLMRLDDVCGCIVAGKGFEEMTSIKEEYKGKLGEIQSTLKETIESISGITNEFSGYNPTSLHFELEKYGIIFSILPNDAFLITIAPALSNRGLLEVEIGKARRKIMELS